MKSRLPDGSTMELTHIETLEIPSISRLARHIHIFLQMQTAPLVSLGFLCDYGCTTTIDKQEISFQNNGEEIIKETRNKKTGMLEVPLVPQQS